MKKILIFVIGILLIIFAFLTFNLFKDNLNSLETTSEMLNINSELVQELYSTINPSEDANVLIGLYENDKISNEYILACGITNYLKEYNIAPEYISKIDVENSIHSIFGYSTPIVHEDVYILNDKACGYFYNSKIEKYQLVSGCGGNNNEKFYRKIISAEKKNNFIFIKEKSIYMYNDWN